MTATEDALTKLVGQGIVIERELRIRILRLEAALQKIADQDYEPVDDSYCVGAARVARAALKDKPI